VVGICAGWLAVVASTNSAEARLRRDLAEAKRIGMPIEPTDLIGNVPPEDNAAPVYRQAILMLEADPKLSKKLQEFYSGKGSIQGLEPLLDVVKQAAAMPDSKFDRKWDEGYQLLFPEYAHMKGFVKALARIADEQSQAGDWRGALKTSALARNIGYHAGSDEILIGALVRIACETITEHQLQKIAMRHAGDPAFLQAALDFEAQAQPVPSLKQSLASELVLTRVTLHKLDSPRELMGTMGGTPAKATPAERALFQSRFVQTNLEERLVGQYLRTYKELPEDPTDLKGAHDAMKGLEDRIERDKSVFNAFNRIVMPVYSQSADAVRRLQMYRRLTTTTLKLLQLPTIPDSLPDLGETSTDPFTGKPFRYRREPGGFVLYSVGNDRKDDGGKAVRSQGDGRDDVVVAKPVR
jgi:hypothetical protein